MKVLREQWGEIPLLHVVKEENSEKKVPVVFFFHGFTSAKEHNLHYAYQLANRGIRVILPDAALHGERDEGLDEIQLSLRFWETVVTSVEELSFLKEELQKKGLLDEGKIGVAGTSMGGIVTCGALKMYPWISVASVMMGTPAYVQLATAQITQFENSGFNIPLTEEERSKMLESLSYFDLTKNKDALNKRPLFFWHGEKDPTVPFEPTYNFYNIIKEDYHDVPEKLKFMNERKEAHAVTRRGMLAGTAWLADHLNGTV